MTARKPDDYPEPASADVAAGHEISDVTIAPLITFLIGLVLSLVATVFFISWLFDFYQERFDASDPVPSPLAELRSEESVPGPHLQRSPRSELDELRERDREILHTSAWLDQQKKIAREPIDLAIQQVARDGLPKWPRVEEQSSDAATKEDRK
jgi:hypothetical protein